MPFRTRQSSREALASVLAAGWVVIAAIGSAQCQAMREVQGVPFDCRSLLAPAPHGTVRPWQSFIQVEHCDRIKRLLRLSALLPPDKQPRFYEGVVPASRLPAEFRSDLPVLRVVFPDRTFFDTAKTELRPEVDQVLAIVAESLRHEPPDVALFVAGHADARGARGLNERLSIDRAEALAQRIYRAGVSLSSIWRVGFGSDMPLEYGATPYAWDRNRRVEFLFAAKPEAIGVWLADQQLDSLCEARNTQEVSTCKAHLDLRSDYTALEIGRKPAVDVEPAGRAPKMRLPSPVRVRATISPTTASATALDPRARKSALIDVDPMGIRRIHIDPRARQVTPVHLDL